MNKLSLVEEKIKNFSAAVSRKTFTPFISSEDMSFLEPLFLNLYTLNDCIDNVVCEKFIKTSELRKMLKNIDNFRMAYGVTKELELAKKILDSKAPWKTLKEYKYYYNYEKLIEAEFSVSGIKENDNVLFLGSGPCPLTLILLSSIYKVKTVGFEQDGMIAELSSRLIKCLELDELITIKNSDHSAISQMFDFDLIMVGESVRPKKQCFNHLAKVLLSGARLVHRINEFGLKKLLDSIEPAVPEQFKLIEKVWPGKPVMNTISFYKKI